MSSGAKITRDMTLDQKIGADFGGHILDPSFSFYQAQKEGDAQVHVQKVLVGKAAYTPLPIGSPMPIRPGLSLIKEDNYTDIGGGYATIHRHYAKRPLDWFDYEQQECLLFDGTNRRWTAVQIAGGYIAFAINTDSLRGVNYDFIGVTPTFRSFGYQSRARRQMSYLCKATRYYLTLDELDEYASNDFSLPGKPWVGSSVYPDGHQDNTFSEFSNGEGGIIKKPDHLFVNEPRWRQFVDESIEGAIIPDRIVKWRGNIYELTRYTTSLY